MNTNIVPDKTSSSDLTYVVTLSLVLLFALGGLGWFGLTHMERQIKSSVLEHLSGRLPHSIKMIKIWERSVKMDASTIASDSELKSNVEALLKKADAVQDDVQSILSSEELKALRSYLKPISESYSFIGFSILNEDGLEIASQFDEGMGTHWLINTAEGRRLFRLVGYGNTVTTLPFKSEIDLPDREGILRKNSPTMVVGSPVYNSAGAFSSVLIFYLRPEAVFTDIFGISQFGRSGETYTFDATGRMLTKTRFEDHLRQINLLDASSSSVLNIKIKDPGGNLLEGFEPSLEHEQLPFTRMAESALKNESGFDIEGYRDYRGVKVLGVWSWLSEFRFGVASEINYDEAYDLLFEVKKTFYGILGLLIFAVMGVIWLTWRQVKTNQKLVETTKLAEKANHAKSLFLANMSHEIRTPLNAILGFSQILMRNKELDQKTRDSIGTIDTSGKNLLSMINEILDISKIEAGKMELVLGGFKLNRALNDIVSLFTLRTQQKKIDWVFNLPEEECWVNGDETKLRQSLINLIGNAVKFTDSGEVKFNVIPSAKNMYLFEVIDTGMGIPEDAQKLIFEPFSQEDSGAKMGGTGLGLAITTKQLFMMGSELKLESLFGEGSRFYFELHLPPSKEDKQKSGNQLEGKVLRLAEGCNLRALVVDDVKENRDVLAGLLEDIGAKVINAENGLEGLEKTREHFPDIIFMDMRMPIMRGEDAVKQIVEEFGPDRFKIVSITASAFGQQLDSYLKMGCHGYVSKPFKEEDIFVCIKDLLNVEYIYEDHGTTAEDGITRDLDFSSFDVPEELMEPLKVAAELYNLTGVEKSIANLSEADDSFKPLVDHIKVLAGRYEMEEIIAVLDKVKNGLNN